MTTKKTEKIALDEDSIKKVYDSIFSLLPARECELEAWRKNLSIIATFHCNLYRLPKTKWDMRRLWVRLSAAKRGGFKGDAVVNNTHRLNSVSVKSNQDMEV